jgi:glucose/arabinose dehydrogenase
MSSPSQFERFLLKSILLSFVLIASIAVSSLRASALPGFRAELIASTAGFASSVAADSSGRIYYTTTKGDLFRVEHPRGVVIIPGVTPPWETTLVAHVVTEATGDSGLLGMALVDDRTAVVHYTRPGQAYDVISKIDLTTGAETVVHEFVDDISFPGRATPPEHHGGNPSVGADGSIFVGIGDFGGGAIAALPEWNGGKIFRIHPDGEVEQFARGFRNPFDLVWDAAKQRIIACDNGPDIDDEIDIVTAAGNYGWPYTVGKQEPIAGDVPPRYVFPQVVAPTGMIGLNGANSMLPRGYLIGSFVSKAIYLVPDIDAEPLPDPIPLIQGETSFVIDVAQSSNGTIYFVSGSALYRLVTPQSGDCNGDGVLDFADLTALRLEFGDGDPQPVINAQNGAYRGSWGCDVDGDGLISSSDYIALSRALGVRGRAVRSR